MPELFKLKSIFSFLNNNRGETINGEPEPKPNEEGGGAAVEDPKPTEPVVDWESDDNPYKKRYGDSQSQVQPLVKELQNFAQYDQSTKTWSPKTVTPVTTPTESFEGYDPEFVKNLESHTKKQVDLAINEFKKESISTQKYNSNMLDSRSKALEEFGSEFDFNKDGKMNTESPLYKLADEIITNKYVELNPNGTFHKYNNDDAEYLSTAEAYALLSKRAKKEPADKEKLNAIQGKGSREAGVKKTLSYEEYRKLSSDEQDAHDLAQSGG